MVLSNQKDSRLVNVPFDFSHALKTEKKSKLPTEDPVRDTTRIGLPGGDSENDVKPAAIIVPATGTFPLVQDTSEPEMTVTRVTYGKRRHRDCALAVLPRSPPPEVPANHQSVAPNVCLSATPFASTRAGDPGKDIYGKSESRLHGCSKNNQGLNSDKTEANGDIRVEENHLEAKSTNPHIITPQEILNATSRIKIPANSDKTKSTNFPPFLRHGASNSSEASITNLTKIGPTIPLTNDVLIGPSGDRTCFHHIGNRRFRVCIELNLCAYFHDGIGILQNKLREHIVDRVIMTIRACDPPGRFVRKCNSTGRWIELTPAMTVRRVHQTFLAAGRALHVHHDTRVTRVVPSQLPQSRGTPFVIRGTQISPFGGKKGKITGKFSALQERIILPQIHSPAADLKKSTVSQQPPNFSGVSQLGPNDSSWRQGNATNLQTPMKSREPFSTTTRSSSDVCNRSNDDVNAGKETEKTTWKPCNMLSSEIISDKGEIPNKNDVLYGRGVQGFNHVGNLRFRVLIEINLPKYMAAGDKKETKGRISSSIVDSIRSCHPPGRFLSKCVKTGNWIEMNPTYAREKTGQAFREFARAYRAANNLNVGSDADSSCEDQDDDNVRIGEEELGKSPPRDVIIVSDPERANDGAIILGMDDDFRGGKRRKTTSKISFPFHETRSGRLPRTFDNVLEVQQGVFVNMLDDANVAGSDDESLEDSDDIGTDSLKKEGPSSNNGPDSPMAEMDGDDDMFGQRLSDDKIAKNYKGNASSALAAAKEASERAAAFRESLRASADFQLDKKTNIPSFQIPERIEESFSASQRPASVTESDCERERKLEANCIRSKKGAKRMESSSTDGNHESPNQQKSGFDTQGQKESNIGEFATSGHLSQKHTSIAMSIQNSSSSSDTDSPIKAPSPSANDRSHASGIKNDAPSTPHHNDEKLPLPILHAKVKELLKQRGQLKRNFFGVQIQQISGADATCGFRPKQKRVPNSASPTLKRHSFEYSQHQAQLLPMKRRLASYTGKEDDEQKLPLTTETDLREKDHHDFERKRHFASEKNVSTNAVNTSEDESDTTSQWKASHKYKAIHPLQRKKKHKLLYSKDRMSSMNANGMQLVDRKRAKTGQCDDIDEGNRRSDGPRNDPLDDSFVAGSCRATQGRKYFLNQPECGTPHRRFPFKTPGVRAARSGRTSELTDAVGGMMMMNCSSLPTHSQMAINEGTKPKDGAS